MRALVLALVVLAPLAAAHGGGQQLDDSLVANGQRLMVGSLTAPQPGVLVVVPFVDGPLPCDPVAAEDYRIPLTNGTGVAFVANRTHLQALFDLPAREGGYTALAVDTHEASRALVLMQEDAIALHALVGVAMPTNGSRALQVKTGVLGLPYPIAGTAMHEFPQAPEGQGILMSHDGTFHGGGACLGNATGTLVVTFRDESLAESLSLGKLVHVVAMHDGTVGSLLPRPLDETTGLLRANLYLARPGEDPATIRAALDPAPKALDVAPLVSLGVGLALVLRRS